MKVTLFSQILKLVDRSLFERLVRKHQSDKHAKGCNTWTHFVSMLFLQMADMSSLRDISTGLRSATGNLRHLGLDRAPSRSALSYRNKHRSYQFFEELYFRLLDKMSPSSPGQRLYARRLRRKVFIMDSSIIPLCLSLFDWAKFRTRKGAIKLHAVLDYDSGLPNYAVITDGKKHDVTVAKDLNFPSGSVVVVDRAYVDYAWLDVLDSTGVFFVTRLKKNARIEIAHSYLTSEKHEHILSDQQIRLMGFYASKRYTGKLRIVRVYDYINDKELILLTNNMFWTANTVSELYKARWDVEVFFKHLKQLFRIKSFVGTSANAVRIQMWCAMIAMLLLKFMKNRARHNWHLSNLISFLRLNLYTKINLWEWLDKPFFNKPNPPPNQLIFS